MKARTAGPKLATKALETLRSRGVGRSPRNNAGDGALSPIGEFRMRHFRARERAIQFVIHTGAVYEEILDQYREGPKA